MNYIVEPFLIYLAGIVDPIRIMLAIVGGIGGILLLGGLIEICVDDEIEDEKRFIKPVTVGLIICAIMIVAMMLIPSKETVYEIIAAKLATKENVEINVEAIKSLVDYIASVCA